MCMTTVNKSFFSSAFRWGILGIQPSDQVTKKNKKPNSMRYAVGYWVSVLSLHLFLFNGNRFRVIGQPENLQSLIKNSGIIQNNNTTIGARLHVYANTLPFLVVVSTKIVPNGLGLHS